MSAPFLNLPTEMIETITEDLRPKDIANLAQTCKRVKETCFKRLYRFIRIEYLDDRKTLDEGKRSRSTKCMSALMGDSEKRGYVQRLEMGDLEECRRDEGRRCLDKHHIRAMMGMMSGIYFSDAICASFIGRDEYSQQAQTFVRKVVGVLSYDFPALHTFCYDPNFADKHMDTFLDFMQRHQNLQNIVTDSTKYFFPSYDPCLSVKTTAFHLANLEKVSVPVVVLPLFIGFPFSTDQGLLETPPSYEPPTRLRQVRLSWLFGATKEVGIDNEPRIKVDFLDILRLLSLTCKDTLTSLAIEWEVGRSNLEDSFVISFIAGLFPNLCSFVFKSAKCSGPKSKEDHDMMRAIAEGLGKLCYLKQFRYGFGHEEVDYRNVSKSYLDSKDVWDATCSHFQKHCVSLERLNLFQHLMVRGTSAYDEPLVYLGSEY